TTKAATLGVGMILIAAAVYFGEASMTTRALAIVFFLLLTAPVAAHLIGKASYFVGIPLWTKSVMDDLKDSENSPSELGIKEDEIEEAKEEMEKKDDLHEPDSET